jgi:acyl-CoA reductase-like NAD-dependent aldehyde dehydrogenase
MIIQSFVNRQPTKGAARSFVKKNPYTTEAQHQVYAADLMEAVTAIQTAQKFFTEHKQETLIKRQEIVQKIKGYIEANKNKFARLEAQDQGLPLDFVQKFSIESALSSINEVLADLASHSEKTDRQYSAVGVIAIITSWNLSFRLVAERLVPAIAAGNTVVLKISSMSPVTAKIWAEIIEACDLPAGLVQILVSDDEDVKRVLVTHPGVRAVSFVGNLIHSSEVMKAVTSVGLQQFKKIQIAGGSKNTAAVLGEPDANIFKSVMSSFLLGQGQLAWNSSRLFVLEKK